MSVGKKESGSNGEKQRLSGLMRWGRKRRKGMDFVMTPPTEREKNGLQVLEGVKDGKEPPALNIIPMNQRVRSKIRQFQEFPPAWSETISKRSGMAQADVTVTDKTPFFIR
jgi:hypothetical protein